MSFSSQVTIFIPIHFNHPPPLKKKVIYKLKPNVFLFFLPQKHQQTLSCTGEMPAAARWHQPQNVGLGLHRTALEVICVYAWNTVDISYSSTSTCAWCFLVLQMYILISQHIWASFPFNCPIPSLHNLCLSWPTSLSPKLDSNQLDRSFPVPF